MVRVILPQHLPTLANVEREISLDIKSPVTLRSILDAIESRFPTLQGSIREHGTLKRRQLLRFFACQEDVSNLDPEEPLPNAVATGVEPFFIIGAIAGG